MATNFVPKIVYGETPVEIEFTYPPEEDNGEMIDAKERVAVSISGERQVSIDHIEYVRKIKFSFLDQDTFEDLKDFFTFHAVYGRSFKYYTHGSEADYEEYELKDFKFNPKRIAPRGTGFLWQVTLTFRRAES